MTTLTSLLILQSLRISFSSAEEIIESALSQDVVAFEVMPFLHPRPTLFLRAVSTRMLSTVGRGAPSRFLDHQGGSAGTVVLRYGQMRGDAACVSWPGIDVFGG